MLLLTGLKWLSFSLINFKRGCLKGLSALVDLKPAGKVKVI